MNAEIIQLINLFNEKKRMTWDSAFSMVPTEPVRQGKIKKMFIDNEIVEKGEAWGLKKPDYVITDNGEEFAKELQHAEKLDKILRAFSSQPKITWETALKVAGVDHSENDKLILLKDKYIVPLANVRTHFKPTIEGKHFIQFEGGYCNNLIEKRLRSNKAPEPARKSFDHAAWQKYIGWAAIFVGAGVTFFKACG